MTFEEKIKKLEEIVTQLENEKLGLKESIELYQQAKELSKELNDELNESLSKLSFMVDNDEVKPLMDIESEEKDI